jgi:hypothetical protein
MRKLLFYSFSLLFLWSFIACQKEVTQKLNQQQLKKTTSREGDSLYHTYYAYDDQNRLVSISSSNNQGQGEQHRIDFFYDAQGRMARAKQSHGDTYSFEYGFEYDNQNRIIQKLLITPSTAPFPGGSTYTYDIKGRLIADTLHSVWAKEIFEYTTYTYDQNDNITEVQVFRNNAGVFQVERTWHVHFDNKSNPYSSVGRLLYYLFSDGNGSEYLLSKNNHLKKTFPSGDIVSYDYVYEGDLPKSVATIDSSDPDWISNQEFYY